ncbi:3-oxoacyl-[acyl-carrier-protein] reductase FabG [Rubripirellula tenax]|uniref:3-oxoacyl-[acyl-carrier-protein] reductase FabG n=1 Tax=Rubripirellula tenax TaxID=2528015 RepID=A0A5C6ECE3_9BACT|nr:SDR family oxidoreductase [Rubripirellula tenax]TWU46114.1 3-oxoacyl-[acyl-carrier-protein] reductase FabG [Rubripirellula tenax]
MSNKLDGKRALVTAGVQGIGMAISRALLAEGCIVAVHYFSSAEAANGLKAEFGERVKAFQADLTDPAQAKQMVDQAVDAMGGLEILVNNAGSLVERRLLDEVDMDFWQTVIDVNVTSMMNVTRFAAPALRKANGASVVNLASLAGRKGGHSGSLIYSTAKGAVLTMTRALSGELGPSGVRVNALAPGLILDTSFHNTHTTKASADATIAQIPLGRAGTANDVAHAAVFLAEQFDGFVTGSTLDINGGVYCA